MTRPTFIAFCYDVERNGQSLPKIFIRALLYSTGKRGNVIENMYIEVNNGVTVEAFNVWGHGDEKLLRGSGMFVGETGVSTNHHFNVIPNSTNFEFHSGNYNIQIFATLPGHKKPFKLQEADVIVEKSLNPDIPEFALWFEWQPNKNIYYAHSDAKRRIS